MPKGKLSPEGEVIAAYGAAMVAATMTTPPIPAAIWTALPFSNS